jgi:hypothetical protein
MHIPKEKQEGGIGDRVVSRIASNMQLEDIERTQYFRNGSFNLCRFRSSALEVGL